MRLIRVLAVILALGSVAHAREWTAKDGRKLEAELLSLTGDRVTLKRDSDGRTVTILLSLLSLEDQQWIKARAIGAALSPPPGPGAAGTFRCDFQADDWQSPWNMGNPNLPRNVSIVSTFPGRMSPTNRVLEVTLKQGTHYGADFGYDFASATGKEPESATLSYRICFAADFNAEAVQGGKMPGFGGMYGDTGSAGKRVNGRDAWSARGAYWKPDAQGNIPIGFYVYHADMQNDYGDTLYFNRPLQRGRWHHVRLYIKLNTPASVETGKGSNDGILRAWIDDRPVFERRDLRFRDTSELKIRNAWFHFYHGGGQPASQDYKLWIDDVAISSDE